MVGKLVERWIAEVGVWRCLYDPIPCGMLYAAFAMAVGTGSWLSGLCFMFAFAITQTFFMQLGISVGRLMGRKWSERMQTLFPWLCIIIGLLYVFLFVQRLTPA